MAKAAIKLLADELRFVQCKRDLAALALADGIRLTFKDGLATRTANELMFTHDVKLQKEKGKAAVLSSKIFHRTVFSPHSPDTNELARDGRLHVQNAKGPIAGAFSKDSEDLTGF